MIETIYGSIEREKTNKHEVATVIQCTCRSSLNILISFQFCSFSTIFECMKKKSLLPKYLPPISFTSGKWQFVPFHFYLYPTMVFSLCKHYIFAYLCILLSNFLAVLPTKSQNKQNIGLCK